MPAYWHDLRVARKKDAEEGTNHELLAVNRKPYFFIYRYKDSNSSYKAFIKKATFDCRWRFKMSLEELLVKKDRNEAEETYVYWFYRNSPVSLGDCVMNRLCRLLEDKFKDIKNVWKKKGKTFNYSIYRSVGVPYSGVAFNKVRKILDQYTAELKLVPAYAKANHMDEAATSEYRAMLAEITREECYCNCTGGDELCNILLDLTYGVGKPSQIPWDICGDVIIRNLLKLSSGVIHYYEQDPNGEIEYKGTRFTDREIILGGIEDTTTG